MSQIILAGTPKRQKFIMYLYAYICAKTLLFCKVSLPEIRDKEIRDINIYAHALISYKAPGPFLHALLPSFLFPAVSNHEY